MGRGGEWWGGAGVGWSGWRSAASLRGQFLSQPVRLPTYTAFDHTSPPPPPPPPPAPFSFPLRGAVGHLDPHPSFHPPRHCRRISFSPNLHLRGAGPLAVGQWGAAPSTSHTRGLPVAARTGLPAEVHEPEHAAAAEGEEVEQAHLRGAGVSIRSPPPVIPRGCSPVSEHRRHKQGAKWTQSWKSPLVPARRQGSERSPYAAKVCCVKVCYAAKVCYGRREGVLRAPKVCRVHEPCRAKAQPRRAKRSRGSEPC